MTKKIREKKERADKLLVGKKLASSLKEAQALIYTGKVYTNNRKILNPSEVLNENDFLGIKNEETSFISRGGDKLLSAICELKLEQKFKDKIVLDVGSSTGGFTDCALKHGAKKVIALDIGSNQLAWKLRTDEKVVSIEKTNIKDFKKEEHPVCDIIIADISFNSLANLAPFIAHASTKEDLLLLLLVKPQFELPKELIPPKGVVTKQEDRKKALEIAKKAFEAEGFQTLSQSTSKVKGRTGNQETFLLFQRKG